MKYRHKTTGEEARQIVKDYYDVGKEQIHKRFIENSCDWEQLIDNDYEILSFYSGYEGSPMAYIFEKLSNGLYSKGTGSCTLKHGLEYWKIHSVKRLSDGKVFTVGDNINFNNKGYGKLLDIQFEVAPSDKGKGALCFVNDNVVLGKWWTIDKLSKSKTPLFKTLDNEHVFENQPYWGVYTDSYQMEENLNGCTKKGIPKYIEDKPTDDFVTFAQKENAEKYIRDNEKKYSLNDMVKIANHWAYIKTVTPEVALKVIEKWKK